MAAMRRLVLDVSAVIAVAAFASVFAASVVAPGCSSGPTSSPTCIPGQQQACVCPDGTPRFRLCHSDLVWDACLCHGTGLDAAADVAQRGPDIAGGEGGDGGVTASDSVSDSASDSASDSGVKPAPEVCNGKDDDLDGAVDEWTAESNESCVAQIPAGTFLMGCLVGDSACEADEQPAHEVTFTGFAIDRTEVTQSHWNACILAGKCPTPSHDFSPTKRGDLPVVMVTHDMASTFCAWRGGRLPTEAEWERAASGGKSRRWPWGNTPPDCTRANLLGCGDESWPVGAAGGLGASREGVYDLAGNVAEWVLDQYDSGQYALDAAQLAAGGLFNPAHQGQKASTKRVVRGGSRAAGAAGIRAADRMAKGPDSEYDDIGFRCVYSSANIDPPAKPPTKPEVCNGVDDDLDGAIDEWTAGSNETCVVQIPKGAFLMGCQSGDGACQPDEKPPHVVTLSAFALDRTEVTEAHWAACIAAGKCSKPVKHFAPATKGNYPVVKVSYVMATAFCAWRGGRLPTEAEWERVASHGVGYLWPWGDQQPDCTRANLKGCGGSRTPVGSHGAAGASAAGAFDLAGNVAEWVFDHYDSARYTKDKAGVLNPAYASTEVGATRIARGGSTESPVAAIRNTNRMPMSADAAYSDLGLRCAYPVK